ncbi:MAG: 2Fe-2S iron-sulfur cluster binding protein [Rhodocyclales bacterium]|nr:2Fe-2S iron-sulfur cluster binding protein [Rhodocyclales bacterium]
MSDDSPAKPRGYSSDAQSQADPSIQGVKVSRRAFLQSSGVIAGTLVSGGLVAQSVTEGVQADTPAGSAASNGANSASAVRMSLRINGVDHEFNLEPRTTLLDTLRDSAALTGTKKGCDRGQCGACTVIVNGRRINACLTLAVMHQGDDIVTIEGIGTPDNLHPMQAAFIEEDGFQCGYCTPGQICSAVSLLSEIKRNEASAVTPDVRTQRVEFTADEIRERMSGNICRCGAYPNIVKAIQRVATNKTSNA